MGHLISFTQGWCRTAPTTSYTGFLSGTVIFPRMYANPNNTDSHEETKADEEGENGGGHFW